MSRLRRLHVELCQPGEVELAPDEAHYANRVLRLNNGDDVELFDGEGRRARGVLHRDGRRTWARIEHDVESVKPRTVALTVGVAPPKGERADWLIEKASEVGVHTIAWIHTERSVVELGSKRLERLRRVALAAARQSEQPHLMQIEEQKPLTAVLARGFDRRIIAQPNSPSLTMLPWSKAATTCVLVGPEGGFSDEEICSAVDAGYTEGSLGDSVLRVETAVIAAAVLALSLGADGKSSE